MAKKADPINEIVAQTPDWRGKTLARLRKIIRAADPAIGEAVKWRRPSNPMGAPVWEHGGMVCVGNILKASVRLTFPEGKNLPDPKKMFNSRLDSKTTRAIDVFVDDTINEAALEALIQAAVAYNLAKKKPVITGLP